MKEIRTALLLLAGPGILFVAGCNPPFEDQDLKEQTASNLRLIAKTETDIELLGKDLEEIAEQAAPAEATAEATVQLSQQIRDYTALADELEPKIRENSVLLATYQRQFQVKNTFKDGEVLGDFTLKTGLPIKGAVVTGVRGAEVGIRHSTGIGYYSVGQLPDQFATRILAGPVKSASPVDVAALFESKPEVMKTAEQIAQDRKQEYEDKLNQRKEDREAEMREQEAKDKRRSLVKAQLNALTIEIDQVNKAIYSQRTAKASTQRSLMGGSIRRSEQDVAKQLAPFDRQIAILQEKKNKLEKQKADFEAASRR